MHSDHHLFYPATPTQTRSPPRRSRPLDASPLRRAFRPSPYRTTALVLAQSRVRRPSDAVSDTVSDDEDDALISPLVRYSAYTSPRPSVRLSTPKPKPFGENRNTKIAGTRRPKESNGEKSRKPRSVGTANAPRKTTASNRDKPRASAPSRITAPSASTLGLLPPPQLQSTPDRPVFDLGKLMKTGDSLKKMSLEDNKARFLDWSPTWSDSDASPLARRAFQPFGIMGPPPVPRRTGDIFESIGDSPAPRLNLFASPSTASPVTAPSFQRHVSHAQVLFGGPAIDPPEPQVVTAPAAPEPEEESPFSFGEAGDGSFAFDSSFSIPFLSEPGLSKKFKPHDSGIVVSDESDGSPDGLKQTMPLASSTSSLPENESDFCTETPILSALRKSSAWAVPAVELVETSLEDERALKILLQQGVTGQAQDKEKIAVPGTPVKRNHTHKLFATAPKSRTFHVPAWDIKAPRKSMPVMPFNPVGQAARSPARASRKAELEGLALAIDTKLGSNVSSIRDNRFRPFSTTSSSGESLSATSSLENTPTHGRANAKKSLQRLHLPSRASHAFVQQEEISDINCPGRFEGQFALIDELGNGQFGIVLHVKDKRTEVEYAIKKSRRFEGVRNRKRLWEEVEILKALNARGGHENVLDFVDGWDEDDHLFIQTSLCAMGNLETFLNGYGRLFDRLGEAQVWKIITDVADGLQFIHQRGYIHMDIKPANIFVSDEGRLLIGDFGMASVWPRVKEEGFEREGDREYMAPEVLLGVYGKAADIFSFGMTVLEATANIVVPDMGTPWHKLREDKFDDVDFQHCSAALIRLIRGLMRRDAGLRPTIEQVCTEKPVQRGRAWMSEKRTEATLNGSSLFRGSPLAGERAVFLREVLGIGEECDGMDWSL